MTIEETFASLEDTISVLENKETTLEDAFKAVSYTHLTLPTNREV